MTRPPQFRHDDESLLTLAAVKQALKLLAPADRAHVLAWLLLYYDDAGMMRSPQVDRGRDRVVLGGVEYWLARVPKR